MSGTSTVHVVYNHFPQVEDRYMRGLRTVLAKTGFDLTAEIVGNVTSEGLIDTGAYRASWHPVPTSDDSVEVRSDKGYGLYLELGTSRGIAAKPHILPAVDNVRPKFIDAIESVLRNPT